MRLSGMLCVFVLLGIGWSKPPPRRACFRRGFLPRGRPHYARRLIRTAAGQTRAIRFRRARLCSSPRALMPF